MRWASSSMLRKSWPRWVLGVSPDDACRFCRLGLSVHRVLAYFRGTLFGAGLVTTRNANVMASMNGCRWCSPGLEPVSCGDRPWPERCPRPSSRSAAEIRATSLLVGALQNVASMPSFGRKRPLGAFSWPCGGIALPMRKRRHRAPLLVRDGGPLVCLTLQQLCQMCRKCFLPLLATHVTLPSHRTQWSPCSPLFTCSVVSHPSGGSTKDLCMRSRSGRNVRCVRRT